MQDTTSLTNNVATVTTTAGTNNLTSSVSGSRLSNTATSLIRTTSVITAGPSTSSWNNSAEEELDYVVDPVQGNAYYKGQLLGKVRNRQKKEQRINVIYVIQGALNN